MFSAMEFLDRDSYKGVEAEGSDRKSSARHVLDDKVIYSPPLPMCEFFFF